MHIDSAYLYLQCHHPPPFLPMKQSMALAKKQTIHEIGGQRKNINYVEASESG